MAPMAKILLQTSLRQVIYDNLKSPTCSESLFYELECLLEKLVNFPFLQSTGPPMLNSAFHSIFVYKAKKENA